MKYDKNIRTRIILSVFLLIIMTVGLVACLMPRSFSSFIVIPNEWSGNTSTSFDGGNGTQSNPYIISNGEQLAYFKQVIDGIDYDIYKDKYYVLSNDINMGGREFEPIGIDGHAFMGHLDGNGHTIANFLIKTPITYDDNHYSGLFTGLKNADVENLQIVNSNLQIELANNSYIGVFSANMENTTLKNISIYDNTISITYDSENPLVGDEVFYIGGLVGNIVNSNISYMYIDNDVNNQTSAYNFGTVDSDTSISNIIVRGNLSRVSNRSIVSNSADDFLTTLNTNSTTDYSWSMENSDFTLLNHDAPVTYERPIPFLTSQTITPHASGSEDGIVYINDLLADFNYYMGLNYTYASDYRLPSLEDKNYYNENNLVKMQITYSGASTKGGRDYVGSVSLNEIETKYIYYKVFTVNNNGTPNNYNDDYVDLELIDNPFTNRPTDSGFNGWRTDYRNVVISHDKTYYIRHAKVPVTYTSGKPNDIVIEFKAVWTDAKVVMTGTSFNNTVINNLLTAEMHELLTYESHIESVEYFANSIEEISVDGYYARYILPKDNVSRFPSGAVNSSGVSQTGKCYKNGGCEYFLLQPTGTYGQEGIEYYLRRGNVFTKQTFEFPYSLGFHDVLVENHIFNENDNMSTFFEKVRLSNRTSLVGYYNSNGVYQTSGTCNNSSGCDYYRLIQYYDSEGHENKFDDSKTYYYLTTRDTNIIVLNNNISLTSFFTISSVRPFTLTGIHNGNDYDKYLREYGMKFNTDSTVENLKFYYNVNNAKTVPENYNTSGVLYANSKNVKIGRGIKRSSSYVTSRSFIAAGSGTSYETFRVIIEAGFYDTISLSGADVTTNKNIKAYGIYGNDYDRVTGNNSNLDVYFAAASSWGNNINKNANNHTFTAFYLTVKSGNYGSRRPTSSQDASEYYSYGIYVGGRQGGKTYAAKSAIIEGGYIYNLIGGPVTDSSQTSYNDVMMYVKGGTIDCINGGAGRTESYGNRIVQVTGGTVRYSVFGGSNGITGSSSEGLIDGKTYIYVGGNAYIGTASDTMYGAEAGSVFGIGNGRDYFASTTAANYKSIGSTKGTNIVIDGNAYIKGNVYGGGNYGGLGVAYNQATEAKIVINGGTINGNVYGGANKNDSGKSGQTSNVNISMNDGVIRGSIYGGANQVGIVYGNVSLNIKGGRILGDVYGGGKGGYLNSTGVNKGTYISNTINVVIGDENGGPTIEGSVYGGSAYGTVNSSNESTSDVSNDGVTVTVNNGIVADSVFGGGEGNSTYTPKVHGPIRVTINGGNVGKVYGSNDYAGVPNSTVKVYLRGGTIGSAFGGGHKVGIGTTNIEQTGSTVINNIFGGSDQEGNVTTSNVLIKGGVAGNVFGGNNIAGVTSTANVTFNSGIVKLGVYGGGNIATTNITYVTLNGGNTKNVYGGGAKANVVNSTNITNNGVGYYSTPDDSSTGAKIFGGSNAGGNIPESIIKNETDVFVQNIFGGNNLDGLTTKSKIYINTGNIDTVFGGGNKVGVTESSIELNDGIVNNVFGGANQGGTVGSSHIYNGSNAGQDRVIYRDNITQTSSDFFLTLSVADSWVENSKELTFTINNNLASNITTYTVTFATNNSTMAQNYSNSNLTENNNIYTFNQVNRYWGNNVVNSGGTYQASFHITSLDAGQELRVLNYSIVAYDNNGNRYEYSVVTDETTIESNFAMGNIYGGNNFGGATNNTQIDLDSGVYENVFGGGNQATTTGNSYIKLLGIEVNQSVYGGGNDAALLGNTNIYIGKNTIVGKSVFGGGNHGPIGAATNTVSSLATVNIVGADIGKNVYGGCNTSKVFGETLVNIGANAVSLASQADISDIKIGNTVFGGGESNEAGSDRYDFTAISVTEGININIDGTNYDDRVFRISGSVFGSGNASSSSGPSNILIRKLGTRANPNTAVSIQRASVVVIDNSAIELIGTTDRTNEYLDYKYSFNRIESLKIKNGTVLLLRENANMLQTFESLVDQGGREVKAAVTIDTDTNTVTKNVDNRLYMMVDKMLNVTTDENATEYGVVSGMTFLGMYQKYNNGVIVYGLYDERYNSGDAASEGEVLSGNTRVVGMHNYNHDITVDGFYTNYIDEDYTVLTTDYIDPTPPDSNFYIWGIGSKAINFSITLTASKYSSLGTSNLSMADSALAKGDTIFVITDVNTDGLTNGVTLKDSNFVPKLASTQEEADSIMGVSLKTETSEWTNHGTTKFIKENGSSYFTGNHQYQTDNQSLAPNVMFYLYHAKNISSNLELGSIVVTMQALVPKNEIEVEIYRINITVAISTKDYDDDDAYDASITYSKKYEMPSATSVNITNRSQFTAYFSILARAEHQRDFYGNNNDYYHTLVSSYALPVGTKITMIDSGYDDVNPKYYYMIIDQAKYNQSVAMLASDNEVVYKLSDFIQMDSVSSNNTYDDRTSNNAYFHDDIDIVMEEFLFIFDFKNVTTNDISENNSILFELRNSEDRTEVTVLGIRQNYMFYSIYEDSNEVLSADISIDNQYVYYDTRKDINNNIRITYDQTESRQSIINTNYEDSNLGINITLFDSSNNQVSSSQLSSATLTVNNVPIYVDSNGVFRAKLAEKVSNISRSISFTTGSSLPVGNYKMHIELFASNDGLHNNDDNAIVEELDITVVGSNNMIIVTIPEKERMINGDTGLNENGNMDLDFNIRYASVLSNPNIRVTAYKRNVDNYSTTEYSLHDARALFINNISVPAGSLRGENIYEYLLTTTPSESMNFKYTIRPSLSSGTYRLVFRLYDGNQLIDEDSKYIIVKKKVSD